jgi:hypothetical protein
MPDGDIRGAAADIHNHVAAGLGDGQARANGGDHRLLNQEHFTRLGAISGILNCPLFHLRDLGRYADHDARMHQHFAVVCLLDEVVQHLFCDFEVGDDAVFHRLDGHDIARRTAEHLLGLFADRFHLAGVFVDRDDGGLVNDDALATRIHQGVRGA